MPPTLAADRLVQVWFGAHIVCAYRADTQAAARYAAAMRRRFAGLKVTVEPHPAQSVAGTSTVPSLPSEQMWELIP